MDIVSKKYLKNIISKLNIKLQYNQCRNTFTVIEWFKATKYKAKCRFIKFDIDEFYPSISIELLDRSISFAKSLIDIEGNIINTINHARKSLLFDDSGAWVKKDGNPLFDVTMDSFDGAEVCELVKLYLLNKIKSLLGSNNVGLDRDDGLAIVHKANGPKVDRLRKDIISLFKDEGLSITIDTNLIETDFLDVSFNLNTGKYFPFKKPNNTPLYIHSKSNHPPSIIKQLPSMTNKRISSLSCDETEFNKAKITYETALKNSGYQATLKFEKTSQNTRRNRNRKVIWFNPPFSLNVKTNAGKEFFKLIRRHFPRNHGFSKIFNLNTIKISYSSMKNMNNLIKQQNARF